MIFVVREESLEKNCLISQVEKKSDWIIENSCSHYMTSDMNKFVDLKSHDVRIIRVYMTKFSMP